MIVNITVTCGTTQKMAQKSWWHIDIVGNRRLRNKDGQTAKKSKSRQFSLLKDARLYTNKKKDKEQKTIFLRTKEAQNKIIPLKKKGFKQLHRNLQKGQHRVIKDKNEWLTQLHECIIGIASFTRCLYACTMCLLSLDRLRYFDQRRTGV